MFKKLWNKIWGKMEQAEKDERLYSLRDLFIVTKIKPDAASLSGYKAEAKLFCVGESGHSAKELKVVTQTAAAGWTDLPEGTGEILVPIHPLARGKERR